MRAKKHIEIAQLLPAKRAAQECGIPYTSLRDLAFRGCLPVVKIGTAWYFDRLDLAKFIESAKEKLS